MNSGSESGTQENFGRAWVFLCLAFCAHVADEALTGFLPLYNATVIAMRNQYKWFPMPTSGFREWMAGLIVANVIRVLLSPFALQYASVLLRLPQFCAAAH